MALGTLTDKLELLISVNAQGAIAELEGFAKKSEDAAGRSVSAVEKYKAAGTKMLALGASGLAAGGLLTMMASKDEESANQLKAAIEQTGGSYSEFSEKIDKAVSSQVKFGHTDGEVTSALTALTLATGDTNKALDLMQVAADYAARKHMSLADAATQIGKIFNGSTKPLKEFGIQVKTNADGTKDYAGAVTELSQKLTGQAAAAADTWGGKLKAIQAAVENQVSEFGQKYGPAIMAVSGAMTVLGGATSGVTSLVSKYRAAQEAANAAQAAGEASSAGLTASLGPIGIALAGIGIAAAGVWQAWNDKVSVTVDVQKAAAASAQDLAHTYIGLNEGIGGGTEFLKKFSDGSEQGIGVLQRLRTELQAEGKDTTAVDQALRDAAASQANMTATTDAAKTSTDNAATSSADYAKSLDELSKTLKAQTDPFFAVIHASDQLATAQQNAAQKQDALTTAVRTYGANSPQAAQATRDLATANVAAAEAAGGMDASLRALESSVTNNTTSVAQAQAQLNTWVEEGRLTADQAAQVSAGFTFLAAQADQLNGRHIEMTVTTYYDARGQAVTNALSDQGILQHRAGGGSVSSGTPYLVGEQGPEVFVPNGGGSIVPNGALGGGSAVINLTVNAGMGANGDQIGKEIAAYLEEYVRRGGPFGTATKAALK